MKPLVWWYAKRSLTGMVVLVMIAVVVTVVFAPSFSCFDLTGKCPGEARDALLPDYVTIPLLILLMPVIGESTIWILEDLLGDRRG